jgi:hypothetical protein
MQLRSIASWLHFAEAPLNSRPRKALNHLLDAGPGGSEGGLTTLRSPTSVA